MRSTEACTHLVVCTIQEYIEDTQMHHKWGTDRQIFVLAHMAEANIATYNTDDKYYNFHTSGVIDSDACPDTQVTMLM